MRELGSTPGDVRKIVQKETISVAKLGTVQGVGRGFANVYLGGSSPTRVIIPDQILIADLVAGAKILCVKADRLSDWVATSTFEQPDRYARTIKTAGTSTDPNWSSWGPSLSAEEIIRGWKDDFHGDHIDDRYLATVSGAGSVAAALKDGIHSGAIRMISGAATNRYSRLWLGNEADTRDTLNADPGWIMLCRMRVQLGTSVYAYLGARIAVGSDAILCGASTGVSAYWVITTRKASGSWTNVASDTLVSTGWYNHAIWVHSGRVDYYIDGVLIGTSGSEVPVINLTPLVYVQSLAASTRWMDVDFWATIPL